MRRKISQIVNRGRIDVFINFNNLKRQDLKANLNENLLDSYLGCLNIVKEKLDIKENMTISDIIRLQDVFTIVEMEDDVSDLWIIVEACLERALDNFIKMKDEEGLVLKHNIMEKIDNIKKLIYFIEEKAPKVIEENKIKLNDRITESLLNYELDNNRLYQEFCFMADKLSIDEEIIRLKCHVESFLNHLNQKESSGKKMDFIIQEMNREINTIGSKCNSVDIVNNVIEVKNEIEKIREQIQNIE